MPRTYSYDDAVRLLGGQESAVVRAIDRVSGPLMLGLGVSGVQEILSWFDPRAEFVRASHMLVADLRAKVGPARGRDRTELLAAAHSILVITAYFDAFEATELPFNPKRLRLARADQLTLATGEVIDSGSARELLDGLLRADLPLPAPHEPREAVRARLHGPGCLRTRWPRRSRRSWSG
ncbi:hypothetical protein [Spirillospora sp. NPDC029432]|uniref:NACHT N-terminal helical domain 7-containing protein n=1 Tax=Spirillospora sp. NPDC029432 TaxID=3154599 RepID=UPI00345376C5